MELSTQACVRFRSVKPSDLTNRADHRRRPAGPDPAVHARLESTAANCEVAHPTGHRFGLSTSDGFHNDDDAADEECTPTRITDVVPSQAAPDPTAMMSNSRNASAVKSARTDLSAPYLPAEAGKYAAPIFPTI